MVRTGFLALLALTAPLLPGADAEVAAAFDLEVDASGVALQFDVASSLPLSDIGFPRFEGTSEHRVRSATLASGAHRFVVYSVEGDAISPAGEVRVAFPALFGRRDGLIAIENVTASDASGEVVAASPNALPALARPTREHQSLETGQRRLFRRPAVDLDGAVVQARLLADGVEADADDEAPFSLVWGPAPAGPHELRLVVTDDRGGVATIDLGVFRVFAGDEIGDFASFADIHFGAGASAFERAFDADPLGRGIPNGLAFFLGLNPHRPDVSRLPRLRVASGPEGPELSLLFVRRADAAGVVWKTLAAKGAGDFEPLSPSRTLESDAEDGLRQVDLRFPFDAEPDDPRFISLQVESP